LHSRAVGNRRRGADTPVLLVELTDAAGSFAYMSEVHHHTVFFSGRVQGVGFRYTATQVAKEFEVTGFVTNLDDGRVRLEAEGAEGELEKFVAALQERMHGFVRKAERVTGRRAAQFQGFSIQ
jgi:acylphosphatase